MKSTAARLLGLLSAAATIVSACNIIRCNPNIVPNGDFSNGLTTWVVTQPQGGTVSAVSGYDNCGGEFSSCAQMSVDGTAQEDAVLKQLIYHITPQTTLDVVVYYRGLVGQPLSAETTLNCQFGAGSSLFTVTWTSAEIPQNGSWAVYQGQVFSPTSAIVVGCYLQGPGASTVQLANVGIGPTCGQPAPKP